MGKHAPGTRRNRTNAAGPAAWGFPRERELALRPSSAARSKGNGSGPALPLLVVTVTGAVLGTWWARSRRARPSPPRPGPPIRETADKGLRVNYLLGRG
ncbi:MAG: hypothetical protein ACRD0S_05340, partial [Acidimicrobiales bacterium]